MFTLKKAFWILTSLFLGFSTGSSVFAFDVDTGGGNALIQNPLGPGNNTIAGFINLLLNTIFPIAALLSIFFIIYAGFLMVTAGQNEEKLEKAKSAFLWTVIGVAILLGAKVFSAVICGTISQLNPLMPLTCPK